MKNKQIKTWELERYLLGELPSSRMGAIAELAGENPDIQEEIDHLRQANTEIIMRNPSETMLPEILKQYEENQRQAKISGKSRPRILKNLAYGVPVLASALILIFVVLAKNGTSPDYTRVKGDESLDFSTTQIIIYRQNSREVELLKNGDQAKAGDLLQLGYIPAGKTYGVIFSIDGRGIVTLHYPDSRNGSTLLKQGEKNLLTSSYELDNAPDFERFFFITSIQEIDVKSIINKAESLSLSSASAQFTKLELPESYSQYSILIKKEKRNE